MSSNYSNVNFSIGTEQLYHVPLQEESKSLMKYPDTFRRFFGEPSLNAEPMITGFGILFFVQLPKQLDEATNCDYLTAMTTTLDLPDMSLDAVTYEGRDGGQWVRQCAA